MEQKLIESSKFYNYKFLEEIKNKIKTFMIRTTYTNGFEDWSQRVNHHGFIIHRIKVFKFIIEVVEEPNADRQESNDGEPETNENPVYIVSIYTDTVTIRYGGSLWNQFEACFDELRSYLLDEDDQFNSEQR